VAVYRRSRRQRFLLVLLVLTSITAITLDFRDAGGGVLDGARTGVREAFAPVQRVVGEALSGTGDLFGGLTRYRGVREENVRLRRRLEELEAAELKAADAERERRLLLALQGLDWVGSLRSVSARVVAGAPSNLALAVTIDRGRSQGIDVGMPVVNESGLVGRVTDVTDARATVLLVADPSSNVGVRLTGSGEVGVVAGDGTQGPLHLDLIPKEVKVVKGEGVVTSGLQQGLFPPQIPVGRVRSATTEPGSLSQEILVDPAVDWGSLELVKVLVWKPPAGPPPPAPARP
jgi:rod shape-determining protein MreC